MYITTERMEHVLYIAPVQTLKQAICEGWPHKIIGQIALEAEEAGIDPDVIAHILSGLRKTK